MGAIKWAVSILGIVAAGFGLNELDKRVRYRQDGYNRLGFNREGFDANGYDKNGFDRDGYNVNGFDKDGFDRNGFNKSGYDHRGYDREGRDAQGFDIDGYDIDGFTRLGFDRHEYKKDGTDRSGNNREYYEKVVASITDDGQRAYTQMRGNQFYYALRDIRVGIEKAVNATLAHKLGKGYDKNRLDYNLGICSRYGIFDQDFIDKLYSAKSHCNDTAHNDTEKTYNQVYFCYKVLEEILERLKGKTNLPATI